MDASARAQIASTIGVGACAAGSVCDISYTLALGAPAGNTNTYVSSRFGPITADFTFLFLQFSGTATAPDSSGTFTAPVSVTGALHGYQSMPGQHQGNGLFIFSFNGAGTLSAAAAMEGGKAAFRSGTYTFSGTASDPTDGSMGVPEPATALPMGGGLALLLFKRLRAAG